MNTDEILSWATVSHAVEPSKDFYCATRDIFQARLDLFRLALERDAKISESIRYWWRLWEKSVTILLATITGIAWEWIEVCTRYCYGTALAS